MEQSHRQQPGLACDECRRRKGRCDRVRPLCGSCQDNGTECRYVDRRPQRGPRKGQISALKTIVADLEQRLGEQTRQQQAPCTTVPVEALQAPEHPTMDKISSTGLKDSSLAILDSASLDNANFDNTILSSPNFGDSATSTSYMETTPFHFPTCLSPNPNPFWESKQSLGIGRSDRNFVSDCLDNTNFIPPTTICNIQPLGEIQNMQSFDGCVLSDLMHADLDELFFDRIYPVAPMIRRQDYFVWARQQSISPAQLALQYAMRAVAAAVSAQYRPVSGMLCAESRRLLDQLDASTDGNCSTSPIEKIQGWLLVAHWELLCKHEHQAMLTAGRAVRMVLLARLHEVDVNSVPFISTGAKSSLAFTSSSPNMESFAGAEEKRRTFWVAYCFDRFYVMHTECPQSLHEESIRTRLPAPDYNFQNNEPIRMCFLPEMVAENDWTVLPPFAKCVVLSTLCSHCRPQSGFSRSDETNSVGSGSRNLCLTSSVQKRKDLLLQSYPTSKTEANDPMATFVCALAACAAIYIYKRMAHSAAWTAVEHEAAVGAYEKEVLQAVSELIHFFKSTPQSLSQFKAHPFLPTVIQVIANFLLRLSKSPTTPVAGYYNRQDDILTLLGALKVLQLTNNSSRGILSSLEGVTMSVNECSL